MLAVAGECSGNLLNVGLRDDYDSNAVLVCVSHRDRLRALRPYEAERLCRYLRAWFGYRSGL